MERIRRMWRRSGTQRSSSSGPSAEWEKALHDLIARVEHLEAQLEGLQDAVYRQARSQSEQITDLRTRTQPAQIARDLSEDARRRGLE
jgi:hypothetical protein